MSRTKEPCLFAPINGNDGQFVLNPRTAQKQVAGGEDSVDCWDRHCICVCICICPGRKQEARLGEQLAQLFSLRSAHMCAGKLGLIRYGAAARRRTVPDSVNCVALDPFSFSVPPRRQTDRSRLSTLEPWRR